MKIDDKKILSTQPVNLKSKKNKIKNFIKSFMLLNATLFTSLSGVPTKEVKSQADIEKAVELLNAEDSYYSFINTEYLEKTGKKLSKIKYSPLVLPKGTTQVKVIVENDFNAESKQAIKDSLEEYNSVLKATNQDWQFKYYGSYTLPSMCDIVVKKIDLEDSVVGREMGLPLANSMISFSKIYLDESYDTYHKVSKVFTHELMHYFGAGDLYLLSQEEQKSVDSVMGYGNDIKINTLQANDLKFLFATLDNITTQSDVDRVNNYIKEHLNKFSYVNQQGEVLKQKYGHDFLANQVSAYTNSNVVLNSIDVNQIYFSDKQEHEKHIFLLDKSNYQKAYSKVNSNIKGVRFGTASSSYIDETNDEVLFTQNSREFFDNNALYSFGDNYALFDNNGKLINIFEPVTWLQYKDYWFNVKAEARKNRDNEMSL